MNTLRIIGVLATAFFGGVYATSQADAKATAAQEIIGGAVTTVAALPALFKKPPLRKTAAK